MICGSAKHLWAALYTLFWTLGLWHTLAIHRLTTVRITAVTLVSEVDSVTRPASSKSHTTASFSRVGILAIWSRIVFYSRVDVEGSVSRFLKAGHSSDMGLSVRARSESLPSTLQTGATISNRAVSSDWVVIDRYSTNVAVLDVVQIWQTSRSLRFGLLISVTSSSCSSPLDSVIRNCLKGNNKNSIK